MGINVGDLTGGVTLEDQLSATLDKIHNRLTLTGIDFDNFNKQVVAASTTLGQAANTQVALQAELARVQIRVDSARSTLAEFAAESARNEKMARLLAPAMQDVSREFLVAKSESAALQDSMKLLNREFNTVQEASKITTAQIVSFGRGVQEAGVVLSAMITAPLVAAGGAAIKFGTEFEAASTKIVALAGASREEVAGLSGSVLKLAEDVGVGPAKLAEGLFIVESAGFRGAEAMGILEKAGKMTAIGMGEVEQTTRAVVGAMLTYKNENLDAAHASDILVKTVQLGNMRVDELVGALGRVSPVAAAMGVKFADVNAAIATFTHLGASTDVAATGVRAVLSTILNDGAKTEKGLKSLNIEMSDLRKVIAEKGLTEALLFLVQAASQTRDGMDKLADVFPNIRALTLVLADAQAQGKTFADITTKIRDAAGGLKDSFGATQETLSFQFKQMEASMESLSIKVSKSFLPITKDIVGLIKDDLIPALTIAADLFGKLPMPVQEAAVVMGGLFAVIGPGLILVGTMIRSWGHIMALFGDTAASTVATTSVEAVTGAVGGLTLAAGLAKVAMGGLYVVLGMEVWAIVSNALKLLIERHQQHAAALEEDKIHQLALNEATRIFGRDVTDVSEAQKLLAQHAADLKSEFIPLTQVSKELLEANKQNAIQQGIVKVLTEAYHTTVAALAPDVKNLANTLFNLGYSSAEVVKALEKEKLITEAQKVSIENLHESYKEHEKSLKEVNAAYGAAAKAREPLSAEQIKEATELLALGLGHKIVAENIGAHIAQVDALVKSKADQDRAMKAELKAIDDLSKAWSKYYEDAAMLGATDSEKIQAKMLNDYAVRAKALSDAGVDNAKFYDEAWNLAQRNAKLELQALVEKDQSGKAYYVDQLAQAKDYYQRMLQFSDNWTSEDRKAQLEKVKNLQDVVSHWSKLGNTMDGVKGKMTEANDLAASFSHDWVGALDVTINGAKRLVDQFGDLVSKQKEAAELARRMGGSMDVTFQNFASAIDSTITGYTSGGKAQFGLAGTGTTGGSAYQLAKKGYSFAEIMNYLLKGQPLSPNPIGPRIPGFKEGGWGDFGEGTLAMLHGKEAITPMDGTTAGGVEAGAFVFNLYGTPESLARQVKSVLMKSLKGTGHHFGSS